MIVVTTDTVAGHRIDAVLGEVVGLTVRARDWGSSMSIGFSALGGGEVPGMTQLLFESRQEVMRRLVADAEQRGANAVLAMRLETTDIGGAWTQLTAYGTAAYLVPIPAGEPGATGQSAYAAAQPDAPKPRGGA